MHLIRAHLGGGVGLDFMVIVGITIGQRPNPVVTLTLRQQFFVVANKAGIGGIDFAVDHRRR